MSPNSQTAAGSDSKTIRLVRSVKHNASTIQRFRRLFDTEPVDGDNNASRIRFYRFLADSVPVVRACIATWTRLCASRGEFVIEAAGESLRRAAERRLQDLSGRLDDGAQPRTGGLTGLLAGLFTGLFRDGAFGGFVTLAPDFSHIERFHPLDFTRVMLESAGGEFKAVYDIEKSRVDLNRPDCFLIALDADRRRPLGRSILQAIPFVAFIEQQLVDDMRRTTHNSGYHRLHVKVTPPDRMSGESDESYVDRINRYFDATVDMIRSCDVDENPVTWDNVAIDHIGPENVRAVTNSWFTNHRAIIEEVCAGTNLAPFLLGYSYGATSTWSALKFDLVMRQVHSVQQEAAGLLAWLGNLELALAGIDATCGFRFDNHFTYNSQDRASVDSARTDRLLRLFEAGLISREQARVVAGELV